MTLLEINNLHTTLQTGTEQVHAVRGIDLQVNHGETVCLVGESGSGKSITALSVMGLLPAGIASHPHGEILLSVGRDQRVDLLTVRDDAMSRIRGRRIAMIFQEPMSSLNPVLTIGEQISEAIQLAWPNTSSTNAHSQALQALHDVKIKDPESRINEYPHRLSGGQRQRVMIAMALACEPDLLIADEPTTALDVTVQKEILNLIADLQRRKPMAVLFITHDLGVVAQIADRVAVMKEGGIVEQGDANEVLYAPRHEYTKRLLAALPENLSREVAATEAGEVMLETRNLEVWFPVRRGLLKRVADYVRAVDDVTLKIRRGEIVALVGESGSGKSTLGRAIVRLIEPTGGSIHYLGQDISKLSSKKLREIRTDLQVVFQDPLSSLNPRLTIATTLTEPMRAHGIGADDNERLARAAQLLDDVQLDEDYLWRYPHEFSGGQRQRIGIARALAVNPKLIVCDEITSALDVSVQADLLELLLQLRDRYQLTLLFITHNISVVEFVSDRTLVMKQGKLVESGQTQQVTSDPRHPYTKTLMDSVPRLTGLPVTA